MSNLQKALDAYKNGDLIIVTDDADRENEGDLMLLAEKATPRKSGVHGAPHNRNPVCSFDARACPHTALAIDGRRKPRF